MSGPTNMTKRQMGDYLDELRNNRPSRPSLNGTRSPPPSSTLRSWRSSIHSTTPSERSTHGHARMSRSSSRLSFYENGDSLRSGRSSPEKFERLSRQEQREMERERDESRRISRQLEEMNIQQEEAMMAAARAEAEELVWRYKNPGAPYKLPDEKKEVEETPKGDFKKPLARRSFDLIRKLSFHKDSPQVQRTPSNASTADSELKPRRSLKRLSQKFSLSNISHRRRSSTAKRNISGEIQTEPFPNENQRIYEDPPEDVADLISAYTSDEPTPQAEPQPLHVRRNPFARARQSVSRSPEKQRQNKSFADRVEIQRNPPSQSRNPSYVSNEEPPADVSNHTDNADDDDVTVQIQYRDGKELRSDEMRAATSMRKKDRSARLPSPAVVSDKPERPIVSFDPDWKPSETDHDTAAKPLFATSEHSTARTAPLGVSRLEKDSEPIHQDESILANRVKAVSSARSGTSPYFSRQNEASAMSQSNIRPAGRGLRFQSVKNASDDLQGEPGPTIDTSAQFQNLVQARVGQEGVDSYRSRAARNQIATNGTTRHLRSDARAGGLNPAQKLNGSSRGGRGASDENPSIPVISCTPADEDQPTVSSASGVRPGSNQPPVPIISCTSADEEEQVKKVQGSLRRQPGRERLMSKPHWTPAARDRPALCSQCALPISGKIVTAAGARFHPGCFTCHHCGEALECVAFYPEPAEHRAMRVERNELRAMGEAVEQPEGTSEADDADDSLRFYCHLDFHELFSPRCKSCKTPIEGQVIVACGGEYHPGHFFCAQCGDPFDPTTPFVEKDGYAWCVNCHTNRYAAKCRKCHRPITQMVLNALGTEWHEECFRCTECNGQFTDGRYFIRDDSMAPVCFACEERRLKA